MKKYYLYFVLFVFTNGCYQSSASLIGPAYTLTSTGNVYQTGFTYGLNETLEKKTGLSTVEHGKKILARIEKQKLIINNYSKQQKEKIKKKFIDTKAGHEAFLASVKANIEKTKGNLLD
jgi:hypothetical protein|tara:strand:- start:1157 stop:1513 length:357 start_codon:yes stop_codon:yes gene_type:complete